MANKELTDEQSEQVDSIHSIAYNAMCELLGKEVQWDMEWIGAVADALCDVAMYYFDKTEMEVYPYIDTK